MNNSPTKQIKIVPLGGTPNVHDNRNGFWTNYKCYNQVMLKKQVTQILRYNAIFDPDDGGGFTVTVPKLPGLVTEGDNYEKAMKNVRDAINGYIQILRESNEVIPEPDKQTFTSPVDIHITGAGFAIA